MNYRGQTCTVYPVSWEGAEAQPAKSARLASERAFQGALTNGLKRAGLHPRPPEEGLPDRPIVVTSYVKRADPGSRLVRWLAWPAGRVVFEAAGEVGDAASLFGKFGARRVRMFGWYGGDSEVLLNDAARAADERAAVKIVAILAAR